MLRLSACCCFGGSSTDSLSLSSTASSNGWFCTGRDCVVAIRQVENRSVRREQQAARAQAVMLAWLPIRTRRVFARKEAAQGGEQRQTFALPGEPSSRDEYSSPNSKSSCSPEFPPRALSAPSSDSWWQQKRVRDNQCPDDDGQEGNASADGGI